MKETHRRLHLLTACVPCGLKNKDHKKNKGLGCRGARGGLPGMSSWATGRSHPPSQGQTHRRAWPHPSRAYGKGGFGHRGGCREMETAQEGGLGQTSPNP